MAEKQTQEINRRTLVPSCDIYQDDGKVVLNMEMPGVTRENLDIKVDGERLIINGKRTPASPEGTYRIREIRDGDYHHEFTIDETINREKIEASIKNGVVTISLAIKEAEKPKQISITVK